MNVKKFEHLSETRHRRLGLELEERIVQFLIIDVNLPHFWLDTLPCFSLQRHVSFLLLDSIPHGRNTSVSDV